MMSSAAMTSEMMTTVDVRQMLCAQALALVAKAAARLQPDHVLKVLYDTEDVKRDVLMWAQDRGYAVQSADSDCVVLKCRDATSSGRLR